MTTVEAASSGEFEAEIIELPVGLRPFPDSQVRKVTGWVDNSPLLARVSEWQAEDRKSPAGRKEPFPLRTMLVAMILGAISVQSQLATTYTEILYLQISPRMRAELGIAEPLVPYRDGAVGNKNQAGKALYRKVLRQVHRLLDLMDPSDLPKGRRLSNDAFAAAVALRREVLCDEDLALRYDRLNWFVNELIEASLQLLPRSIRRRWKGSVAVDATPIPSFARPSRPRRGDRWSGRSKPEVYSADPDAGIYRRTRKTVIGDDDEVVLSGRKSFLAMEATLVVAAPEPDEPEDDFPSLVIGMAPLHRPGSQPGLNAIRALESVRARGYPAGWLAGDRAYTDAKPENFGLPAKALGYRVVLDYAEDHLGVTDNWQGLLAIEGAWYCPAIPQGLIDATKDLRAGRIDDALYRARIAERRGYVTRAKAKEDDEGYIRLRCPASNPHPMARCDLKPASQRQDGRVMVTISPKRDLAQDPPPICTQQSVSLPPDRSAKLRQELLFASPEWERVYHTLRNTIEGKNGFLKDSAREAVGEPGRRRILGVAAQSVFVALMVFAGNYRRIREFDNRKTLGSRPRKRQRRRTSQSIQEWRPAPSRVAHRPEPPPHIA